MYIWVFGCVCLYVCLCVYVCMYVHNCVLLMNACSSEDTALSTRHYQLAQAARRMMTHSYVCSHDDKALFKWPCKLFWPSQLVHQCIMHVEEGVVSHWWRSHGTHMNESCHTWEWIMSHIWIGMNSSCHWWRSHVTRMEGLWMCHGEGVCKRATCLCARVYIYMSVCIYICLIVCVFACVYVCVYVYICVQKCNSFISVSSCVALMKESCYTCEQNMDESWRGRVQKSDSFVCIYTCIRVCICIHTCMCLCVCVSCRFDAWVMPRWCMPHRWNKTQKRHVKYMTPTWEARLRTFPKSLPTTLFLLAVSPPPLALSTSSFRSLARIFVRELVKCLMSCVGHDALICETWLIRM